MVPCELLGGRPRAHLEVLHPVRTLGGPVFHLVFDCLMTGVAGYVLGRVRPFLKKFKEGK